MVDDIKSSGPRPEDNKIDIYENHISRENNSDDRPRFQAPKQPKKGKVRSFFADLSTKQRILLVIGLIVAIGLIAGAVWYFVLRSEPQPEARTEEPVAEAPKPTTEASHLTGLQVQPEVNTRSAIGVMIENSPDARPQSGLKDAGVVYEAVVEGGITRFLAVFQDTNPESVGPVRSVRPYYLDFLAPYNAAIMHVGGSGEALAQIRSQGFKDLDRKGAYWRESSRYAPHNAYTSLPKLREIEQQAGFTPATYEGLVRGGEDQAAAAVTARAITVNMSNSANYTVNYEFDPATNTYKRSVGGKPHMDAGSNTQLSPKVLVVPVIPRSQSGIYSVYAVNGSGKVLVFQNGTVTEGTWSKSERSSQFKFTGSDGQPLKLAPGQTWITLAATANNVSYTP